MKPANITHLLNEEWLGKEIYQRPRLVISSFSGDNELPRVQQNMPPFSAEDLTHDSNDDPARLNQVDELKDQVVRLSSKLRRTRRNFRKERKYLERHLEETLRKSHHLLESYNRDTSNLQNEITGLKSDISELTNEVEFLRADREARAEQVRIAQEQSFQRMDDGKWKPQEDNAVRAEFKKLEGAIRTWAKQYAPPDDVFSCNLSPDDIASIGTMLRRVVKDVQTFIPVEKPNEGWKRKIPFLLMHMIVSKHVFSLVFEHPFHFVGARIDSTRETVRQYGATDSGFCLMGLYNQFQEADEKAAHSWRAQTLRLLHTSGDGTPHNAASMRQVACEELTASVLDWPISQICGELSVQAQIGRFDKLSSLFETASDLSSGLWTQRTHMKFLFLPDLPRFSVNSPVMSAHRLQKLDEGDTRLDGKEILAVIQPAVVAFGNSEGENYGDWKVWLKAIVIVDE